MVVDARGYAPENIRCTITANVVEVIAEKVERKPHGTSVVEQTQTMNRVYHLPNEVNPKTSTCRLSAEGILVVSAKWVSR